VVEEIMNHQIGQFFDVSCFRPELPQVVSAACHILQGEFREIIRLLSHKFL
jgi:hypothetical protein